jgi:hypothetical protein
LSNKAAQIIWILLGCQKQSKWTSIESSCTITTTT